MTLEEKLNKLNPNDYEDKKSVEIINSWKDRVPMLAAQLDFKNHPITAQLADEARIIISGIDNILMNEENLPEVKRLSLIREKKVHQMYLSLFTKDPTNELEIIDKAVSLEVGEKQ